MANIEQILDARENTHGDFGTTAAIAQKLKIALKGPATVTLVQQEALDMICTKLARIKSGESQEIDHWQDIAGYALLVVTAIEQHKSHA